MKKWIAAFLVIVLLLPMGTVAQAQETEKKPFYLMQWTGYDIELSNVYTMLYFWTYPAVEGELMKVSYPYKKTTDIKEVAQNVKDSFEGRPEGTRYINFDLPLIAFRYLAEDVVYMEKAVAAVQEWLYAFLEEYQAIGGELDGLVTDAEYENLYATYIHSRFAKNDPLIYDKIVKNPLYETQIRPLLEERGFKFYPNPNEYTPEIYGIHPNSGAEYAQSRSIWDAVLRSHINDCVTRACSPVWEYYPDALVTDYQSKNIKSWLKEQRDSGGTFGAGGNYYTAGNSNCENTYSVRPGMTLFEDATSKTPVYRTIPGYNRAVYENTPFNCFLYDANVFKNTYLASDEGNVSFWIAHYLYNKENPNSVSETPYYAETLLHMGLLNPEVFLGYIIYQEIEKYEDYEFCLELVDDVLDELNRLVGDADRKPIQVIPTWNDHFVLSGMTSGGRNIWRLTPDTTKVSVEDFKTEGADPTFSVNGQTVTFPQGKIIENGSVRGWDAQKNVVQDGLCGYWIETPVDVMPVITRAENYHSVYPAFGEDYEAYEPGAEYSFKTALPANCWEARKVGNGSATVEADGENQVLALKGNYILRNVNMPKNITAGDSYANRQIWELEVTLPADMAADAELVLLNASGDQKKNNDGGFKIVGDQLYYSENGEYAPLSGVKLTPGSKYRLVREMDFTAADACTSDYYVYSPEGKCLGSAEDVAVGELEIPVVGIGISCTGVAGEAVLLDNYKLYPTGVTAEFALYDAKTGMEVTDPDTPRSADTAYRLSWMNTTNTAKTYKVMAAYYQGDQLVEEKEICQVQFSANAEGVETDVVEAAEGQSIRVYLQPVEESSGNVWMIVIICAGVVLAAGAVALVIWKKKKKEEE